MFWLKSCPRCRGDLYEGRDFYGFYIACLQCGHYLGEAEELVLRYRACHASVLSLCKESPVTPAEVATHDDAGALAVVA